MKLQQLRKKAEGFTIIEVLIVLAIAGLILLIVFLAVPALQRNSRSTQARDEVGVLLAAVNEFAANNNGNVPTAWDATNGQFTGATGTNPVTPKISYFGKSNVSLTSTIPGTPATPAVGSVVIYTGAKCNGSVPSSGAGNRAVAAHYSVEPSSGTTPVSQCQEG